MTSVRVAILPEHVARVGLQTALPRKATDNRSFVDIGDDPDATVQAEASDPAAQLTTMPKSERTYWSKFAKETSASSPRRRSGA